MRIANSVTELIGNTPLVRINRLAEGAGATIFTNYCLRMKLML